MGFNSMSNYENRLWYLCTIIVLIFGTIFGFSETFAILHKYEMQSEYAFNKMCKDELGINYKYYKYETGTTTLECVKTNSGNVKLTRKIFLKENRGVNYVKWE